MHTDLYLTPGHEAQATSPFTPTETEAPPPPPSDETAPAPDGPQDESAGREVRPENLATPEAAEVDSPPAPLDELPHDPAPPGANLAEDSAACEGVTNRAEQATSPVVADGPDGPPAAGSVITDEPGQATRFDYDGLDIDLETRAAVRECTADLHALVRRAAQDSVTIGRKLNEVKARLPHGAFGPWLDAEFGWSEDTAQRWRRVATKFGDKPQFADFAPSVLYLLSAPAVPEAARDEAGARAAAGERITVAKAREIVEENRPRPVAVRAVGPARVARPQADAHRAGTEAGDDAKGPGSPPPSTLELRLGAGDDELARCLIDALGAARARRVALLITEPRSA